jgi:hypothetical protein
VKCDSCHERAVWMVERADRNVPTCATHLQPSLAGITRMQEFSVRGLWCACGQMECRCHE